MCIHVKSEREREEERETERKRERERKRETEREREIYIYIYIYIYTGYFLITQQTPVGNTYTLNRNPHKGIPLFPTNPK